MHFRILLFLLLLSPALRAAEARIDLGELQLDTDYAMEQFRNYIATFTAPRTGTLTVSCTTNDALMPYHEVLDDMEKKGNPYQVTYNQMYGAVSYDFPVEAGTTYVMYRQFIMNEGTSMRLTMHEQQAITLTSADPELDGTLNISNGGRITFDFDKAVAYTSCRVGVGDVSAPLSPRVSTNSIGLEVKSLVWGWLQNGTARPGDSLVVTLEGVRMAADKTVLYDGTGTLRAAFLLGPMPITLVSEENTDRPFLSYYTTTDTTGLVRLTFSGPVAQGAQAQLRYGDIDLDADGDYYVEYPPVSVEGNTVTINLQGHRRRPADMVASGKTYPIMQLGLLSVFDTNGNYAYADGQGSLGSYWYGLNYREVTANVVCEFTPANGASLDGVSTIELWITDEAKLTYDGISFAYLKDGRRDTLLVTDYTRQTDPDDATATILSIPVPEELAGATDITVTLAHLQSADGSDFSTVLRARYNAFIIARATPVAGATIEYMNEGTQLRLATNRDQQADRLDVCLHDAADTLFNVTIQKENGKFTYTLPRRYRLVRGHDYRLDVTALAEADTLGSDYIVYHGAADPFRYSIVAFESLTPDTSALLPIDEPVSFTATFDGLVRLEANAKATPVDPDADGLATAWTLVVDSLPQAPTFELRLVATDAEGLRVEGNYDRDDYSELRFTFRTDYVDAIAAPNAPRTHGTVYDLTGRRVEPSRRGLYIKDGRKIAICK